MTGSVRMAAILMLCLIFTQNAAIAQNTTDEATAPCMSYAAATDAFRGACAEFVKAHPSGDVAPQPDRRPRIVISCPSGIEFHPGVARTQECGLMPGSNAIGRQLDETEMKCLRTRALSRECVTTGYEFCDEDGKNCASKEGIPCYFEGGMMKCDAQPAPATEPPQVTPIADTKGDNCTAYQTRNPVFFRKCREFMAKHPGGIVRAPADKRVSLQIVCPPDSSTGTSDGETCGLGPGSNRIATHLTQKEVDCIKAPNLTTECIVGGYLFCQTGEACLQEKLPCMFTEGQLKCMDEEYRWIED